MQDGSPAPVRTELRCILADDTLFFGVRCHEPLLDQVGDGTGPKALWADDSLEFFLDFEGAGHTYCQLVVNASGETAAGWRGPSHYAAPKVRAKTGRWKGASGQGWSVEFAVPVAEFSPSPGKRWGFHVCRNRRPVRGTLMWSWVGHSNHNADRYGSLML